MKYILFFISFILSTTTALAQPVKQKPYTVRQEKLDPQTWPGWVKTKDGFPADNLNVGDVSTRIGYRFTSLVSVDGDGMVASPQSEGWGNPIIQLEIISTDGVVTTIPAEFMNAPTVPDTWLKLCIKDRSGNINYDAYGGYTMDYSAPQKFKVSRRAIGVNEFAYRAWVLN